MENLSSTLLKEQIEKLREFAVLNDIEVYEEILNPMFSNYEIWPVEDLSQKQDRTIFVTCDPSKATLWSVYAKLVTGELQCIADCKDKFTADHFYLLCTTSLVFLKTSLFRN